MTCSCARVETTFPDYTGGSHRRRASVTPRKTSGAITSARAGGMSKGQDIADNKDDVDESSEQIEDVQHLVWPDDARVDHGPLQRVADPADRVEDAAQHAEGRRAPADRPHQGDRRQEPCPAHAHVEPDRQLVGSHWQQPLADDPDHRERPHQQQESRAQRARQQDHVDRRVGAGDQDVDGAVVEALEEVDERRRAEESVVRAAGEIEQTHAQPEDADAELAAAVAAGQAPQQAGEVEGREEPEQVSQRGNRVPELHALEHAVYPPSRPSPRRARLRGRARLLRRWKSRLDCPASLWHTSALSYDKSVSRSTPAAGGKAGERQPEGAMRNQRVWGVAATLALAFAAPATRADDGAAPRPQGLWSRMFAGPAKPDEPRAGPADEDARQEDITARVRAERQKADAQKALEDYLRRLKVVDRLVEIALYTNNPALEKKARELEERAAAVFAKKNGPPPSGPEGIEPSKERPTNKRSAPRREEP